MKETKVIHKWHGTEEALIGEHNKKALLVIAEKNALIGTVLWETSALVGYLY